MTTALAVKQVVGNLDDLRQVATLLAASGYFDAKGLSETAVAQIATKILAGQELGYGPFASVQGIHVIQGRPAMSANLMAAAVKGSTRYDYRVRQMDDNAVKIEFFERVGGKLESLGVSTFTAQDAQKAGTQNMAKFGRNMMFARAMSNGVRWFCPDVFMGSAVYVPEELGATVDGDGNVIEASRQVDVSTGEVTYSAPPVTEHDDNPFADATTQSDSRTAVERAFHASGTQVFGRSWNAARPWLLRRYTNKVTPGNVREHTGDMTPEELRTIMDTMTRAGGTLVVQFETWRESQMAASVPTSLDDVPEIPVS